MKIFYILMLVAVPQLASAQNGLRLSGELIAAIDAHRNAYNTLNELEAKFKQAEAGQRPDFATGTNWLTLSNKFKNAADSIKLAKLPSEIDLKPFSIDPTTLGNCILKNQSLEKLRGYEAALNKVVIMGQQEIKKTADALNEAARSTSTLKYLIETYSKVAADPSFGSLFSADLFAMLNNVSPSLGEYRQALNAYSKKLTDEVAKVEGQRSRLNGNIVTLNETLCRIEGVYKLKISNKETLTLTIRRNGSNYTGSYKEKLPFQELTDFKVNSNKLSFTGVYSYWDGYRYCCPSYYSFTAELDKGFSNINVKNLKTGNTFTLARSN